MASKARTSIAGPRQTGKVLQWKGKFGWIQPSKPIQHPSAQKNQGKVYLGAEDVQEELDGVGALVSFTLYSDSSGLGAADVKMSKGGAQPPATKPAAAKPAAAKPAAGKAAGKGVGGKFGAVVQASDFKPAVAKAGAAKPGGFTPAAAKAKADPKAKAKAKAAAPWPGGAKPVAQTAFQKKGAAEQPAAQKGKAGGKGKQPAEGGKGKGKGKQPKVEEGKRELIHDAPLLGTISAWKGKFGWVTPHDEIEHPAKTNKNGDIYVAQEDVEDEIDGVGSTVQFMLYQDGRGLGAQNVKPA